MPPTQRDASLAVAKENNARYIDGLCDELEGYRRSGNAERARQVEAEIRRCGGSVPARGKGRQQASVEPTVVPAAVEDGLAEHVEGADAAENLDNAPLAEDVTADEAHDGQKPPAKSTSGRRRIGNK